MEAIKAVLLEPVGCLAEFRAAEFDRAARDVFGFSGDDATSGSHAYWRLLAQVASGWSGISDASRSRLAEIEMAAVEQAELYEDIASSLQKLCIDGCRRLSWFHRFLDTPSIASSGVSPLPRC